MKKIMAVASGGGHWAQLKIISESFPEAQVVYVTTTINRAALEDKHLNIRWVSDADIENKFKLIQLAIEILWQVLSFRPDIVISTGAAPGFFAIIYARLCGAKTIWIDSIANYEKPSLSGAKIQKLCHLYLTQWPHLSNNKDVKYWGNLI
jgi:UDP-N-acetylglucosamine:LPS N-acetylglucosamine transferase